MRREMRGPEEAGRRDWAARSRYGVRVVRPLGDAIDHFARSKWERFSVPVCTLHTHFQRLFVLHVFLLLATSEPTSVTKSVSCFDCPGKVHYRVVYTICLSSTAFRSAFVPEDSCGAQKSKQKFESKKLRLCDVFIKKSLVPFVAFAWLHNFSNAIILVSSSLIFDNLTVPI